MYTSYTHVHMLLHHLKGGNGCYTSILWEYIIITIISFSLSSYKENVHNKTQKPQLWYCPYAWSLCWLSSVYYQVEHISLNPICHFFSPFLFWIFSQQTICNARKVCNLKETKIEAGAEQYWSVIWQCVRHCSSSIIMAIKPNRAALL